MYIYLCNSIYTYIHIYIYIDTYVYIYIHTHTNIYKHALRIVAFPSHLVVRRRIAGGWLRPVERMRSAAWAFWPLALAGASTSWSSRCLDALDHGFTMFEPCFNWLWSFYCIYCRTVWSGLPVLFFPLSESGRVLRVWRSQRAKISSPCFWWSYFVFLFFFCVWSEVSIIVHHCSIVFLGDDDWQWRFQSSIHLEISVWIFRSTELWRVDAFW